MIIYNLNEIAWRCISIMLQSAALIDFKLLLILKEIPLRLHKKSWHNTKKLFKLGITGKIHDVMELWILRM